MDCTSASGTGAPSSPSTSPFRQGDDARLGGSWVDVDAPAPDRRARQLGHERRSVIQHLRQHGPVHPALEAVGRLGVELVPAGGPADGARDQCGLEEDAGGALAGSRCPPRPSRRRARAARSAMSRSSAIEAPLLAVERGERLLRRPGAARRRSRAGHPVEVEGMQRVPELEQDEVGHVDHVGDASARRTLEASGSQRGDGPMRHALDHPGGVAVTLLRGLDPDPNRVAGRAAPSTSGDPGQPHASARAPPPPRARCRRG